MSTTPVTEPGPAGGSQSALRQANEWRVMEALRASGPASQAALARATGLSRQTVHNVVRALTSSGSVQVSAGVNGRETLVQLCVESGAVIGVDIDYQMARAALIDLPTGERTDSAPVVLSAARDASTRDIDTIVQLVAGLLEDCQVTPAEVRAVGLSVPQPYDVRRKKLTPTPFAPGWAVEPIVDILAERLGVEVLAENDANAAALAEMKWGAGRDCADLVFVMAAFGIGAGMITDGALFRGGTGTAGEIGHITLDDRGPMCTCGKRGDLGSLASGRALVNQMRALGDAEVTLEELIGRARSGEMLSGRLLADAGRYIGLALAHVVGILAPSRIVLGGPLAAAGAVLVEPIAAALRDMAIDPVGGRTELVTSALGADAALLGAVATVVESQSIATESRPSWVRAGSGPDT